MTSPRKGGKPVGIAIAGRIGRLVTRATLQRDDLQVVAINDPLMDAEDMAYLLKYDTTQGTLTNLVHADGDDLVVDGRRIHCTSHANPEDIPWMERGVDVVCEASGKFLDVARCVLVLTCSITHTPCLMVHYNARYIQQHPYLTSCNKHIDDAIPVKVILCAPGKTDDIPMFVYGVNHQTYQPHTSIISNASCTTNCLAPVCKVLQEEFGIQHGLMTTVHATTATQRTVDGPSKKDRRRGRAAAHNIFPTSSGAAKAVAKVVPGLDGKLTGLAVRIPPTNGSLVDLSVVLETPTTYQSVMHALKEAAEGPLKVCCCVEHVCDAGLCLSFLFFVLLRA